MGQSIVNPAQGKTLFAYSTNQIVLEAVVVPVQPRTGLRTW